MCDRIMAASLHPQSIHVLMPRIWEVLLYKTKGTLQIRLSIRTLEWGDYPGLPESNQCNHKCSYKWKGETEESQKEM